MCTLVLLRRPGHAWPLIMGANRDEMTDRPWRPPARHWLDRPDIVAGLDMLAGGSWLGINDNGVVAAVMNRTGTLGPLPGRRSRGELVLEALDHADASSAASALAQIEPASYRPFNLVIADDRDAFWLRHAEPDGSQEVTVSAVAPGLHMLTAGDIDDEDDPRIRNFLPRFRAAAPPDPDASDSDAGNGSAWEGLLGSSLVEAGSDPEAAMSFSRPDGFGTVASSLVALPSMTRRGVQPVFRFAARAPQATPWTTIEA
jgi:hypothetical protein